jgi:hypothetical protein
VRGAGIAGAAGGLLFVLDGVADLVSPADYPLGVVLGPAVLLLLVGYLGFHVVQRARTGVPGKLALAMVVPGLLLDAAGKAGIVGEPVTVVAVLTFMAGSVLFGIATYRAGVFPHWCAVAFVLPLPLPLMLEPGGGVVTGLAYVALGAVLSARATALDAARRP